jgi:hypothetical protein
VGKGEGADYVAEGGGGATGLAALIPSLIQKGSGAFLVNRWVNVDS